MSAVSAIAAVWLAIAAAADGPDQQAAIQAAFQAAEALQGPLDGRWRLEDQSGRALFIFELSDAGGPPAPLAASPDHPGVEGAWRDPGRAGSPGASGVIDSVRRDGGRILIRFVEGPDRRPWRLTLELGRDGRWTGELTGAGPRRGVVMARF